MKIKSNHKFLFACFGILAAFSASLLLIDLWTISHISDRNSDTNATALAYIMQPIPEMMDHYFIHNIDEPMETVVASTPFISYSFTTPRYPAGDDLKERMRSDLQALTDSADAILGAFVYTSATDSFLYSPSLAAQNSPFADCEANLRDIIYNYNAGTMSRLPFYAGSHTTFKLQYHDVVLMSKDLTPSSGIAVSTLFTVVDMNRLANYIFKTESFRPYTRVSIQIGLYDSNNVPFYQSKNLNVDEANEILWRASSETDVLKLSNGYGISFTSDLIACQYVFIVGRDFLSPFTQGFSVRDLIAANLIVTVFMITLALVVIRKLMRASDLQISVICNQLSCDQENLSLMKFPNAFKQISSAISTIQHENDELKRILPHAAKEALHMVLFRMLSGGQVDSQALETALRYTSYGFDVNDIYVAGVVCVNNCDAADVERRYAVNSTLNDTLNDLREKGGYHCIAVTLDAPFHALVLSFSHETSIARGKQVVNGLIPKLTEALSRIGAIAYIGFGHLYHSIYDLPFSFHEAMSQVPPVNVLTPVAAISETEDVTAMPDATPEENEAVAANKDQASMSAFIDRRAAQIIRSVYEGKQSAAEDVLDRTLDAITKGEAQEDWPDCAIRLVNCSIEAMMTHVFTVPDQLTDVSRNLIETIQGGVDGDELIREARKSILALCANFTRILEKQNSPYITATLEYIDNHYMDQDLSLEEIAEQLKIAPNYLSSLFSKIMGRKLFDYINEVRLKKSLEELVATQDNINDIIERCGFGSRRNYIRIFKKYMNTTPTAWRKEQLGKADTLQ